MAKTQYVADFMSKCPLAGYAGYDRPWLASYPNGVPKSLAPYPEKSLYSLLEDAARRHPNSPHFLNPHQQPTT